MSPTGAEVEQADLFASVARDLLAETGVAATLDRVAALAVETVVSCEAAGVSIVRRRRAGRSAGVDTPAATSSSVRRAHELQDELREGPCWDAVWQESTVGVDDLALDRRWPVWAPRVRSETGFTSVLSLRLYNARDTLGSLNLYSRQPAAFDEEARSLGLVLAAHAAVALTGSQLEADLIEAAAGRLVIGQAEGIMMERDGVDAEQAFRLLRATSNSQNVRLQEVARRLVAEVGGVSG